MDLESSLRRDLHGELLGRDGRIECDYAAPSYPEFIDPSGRICYEAIRIEASPTLDGRLPLPSGWGLDAARCADHEVSRIPYRTAGFDEALISLEVVPVEGVRYAVDGESIRLLDRSPPEEGGHPVEAPSEFAETTVDEMDYGYDRLVRQAVFLPTYRYLGYEDHIAALTAAMDRDEETRRDDASAAPRG